MCIGLFWCVTKDIPYIEYAVPVQMRFTFIVVLAIILFAASGHLQMAQIKDVLKAIVPFKIVPRDNDD